MPFDSHIDCKYCQNIRDFEQNYPHRSAIYSNEGIVYRCAWHSQFQCHRCGNYSHFSWLYWCPEAQELVCGSCNEPNMKPLRYWDKTYAYQFYCEKCGTYHYDLLYAEYCGAHPWQNNAEGAPKPDISCVVVSNSLPLDNWVPDSTRTGQETRIEDALQVPNHVIELKKRFVTRSTQYYKGIIPESEIDLQTTADLWEKNSANWLKIFESTFQDKGDLNRQYIIDPELIQTIGNIHNKKILDAGCGSGYLSRKLARLGAHVTGIDISHNFIDYCKLKEEKDQLKCQFIHGSLSNLDFLQDDSFDMVVSNVVMVDIPDYQQVFNEIARILRPKGKFIWSNVHPVFGRAGAFDYRLPLDTHRKEERIWKIVDRYFDSGGYQISWGSLGKLWQIDRTLSEYTAALRKAGFIILEIKEPKPSLENIQKYPHYLAFDAERFPHFIIFDCMKLSV